MVVAVLAVVPIATGLMDIVAGAAVLPGNPPVTPELDSNYRFFATIWFGAGLVLAWIVPRVERATTPLRAVCGVVFLGGLARCLSIVLQGMPAPMFVAFTVLELVAPPILILWQNRIRTDV